jgi:putative serine protease PepD
MDHTSDPFESHTRSWSPDVPTSEVASPSPGALPPSAAGWQRTGSSGLPPTPSGAGVGGGPDPVWAPTVPARPVAAPQEAPRFEAPTAPYPAARPPRPTPSAPPLADGGVGGVGGVQGPPPWRPFDAPAPAPVPEPKRRGGGARKGFAVLAVAGVFAAGVGGVLVGRNLSDGGSATASQTTAAQTEPVATVAGPVAAGTSDPIAAVAAALSPAVVQIQTNEGLGSGFVYDASGLILTAAHVTDGASTVEVTFADGTNLQGKVLGSDQVTDVSVVKVEPTKALTVAKLATGVDLQVGQTAVAIGSPFGLDQTVTSGIVSALGRSTETPGGVIPAIQTDAPINSGNSGGALADSQGRVIGINDSIITGSSNSQSTGNVGIGFAIPIEIAKVVADRIVAGESTTTGYLGVRGADATGDQSGARIASVETGSPAATAGIEAGDLVTAVDGTRVASMIDLQAQISTRQPGDKVTLTLQRNGTATTVEVTLGAGSPSN